MLIIKATKSFQSNNKGISFHADACPECIYGADNFSGTEYAVAYPGYGTPSLGRYFGF
jgi:hypothetical protein